MERLDATASGVETGETLLKWTAQPIRRRWGRGLLAFGLILIGGGIIGHFTKTLFWGVFSGGVLFLSLEAFFLPTHYEITSGGLSIRKTFSKANGIWSVYRRVYEDRYGLTLSPYRHRTMLEPYRSARILFDGGDREAICRTIRSLCPEADWIPPKGA
jgi:hypothetical protein